MLVVSSLSVEFRRLTLICFRGRLPILGRNDRQADLPLLVDVRMVDFGFEANLGRFERVLGWECDFNPESALVVRWIILREHSVSERTNSVTHAEFRHPLDLLFVFALPSRGDFSREVFCYSPDTPVPTRSEYFCRPLRCL